MIKVSVIMPVYNSEQYIENTINSILKQSLDEFELILVDDGSNDRSGIICDEIAEKDFRVVVIHKENGGICSARNAGLEIAQGEYIAFCDNDDEYMPGLLEDNYNLAVKYNADLVRFNRVLKRIGENGRVSTSISHCPNAFFLYTDFAKNYSLLNNFGNVWAGMYRNSTIKENKCRFDESIKFGFEDQMFNLKYFPLCKRVVFNSKVYYKWIQRYNHSTSCTFNNDRFNDLYKCLDEEQKNLKNIKGQVSRIAKLEILYNRYICLILEDLQKKNAKITLKQKKRILATFYKKQKLCCKEEFEKGKKELFKNNKKRYFFMCLFFGERYGLMLIIFKIYMFSNSIKK